MPQVRRACRCGVWLVLCVAAGFLSRALLRGGGSPPGVLAAQSTGVALETPDQVCAGCHRAIYDRYEATSMARGSGLATSALLPGSFDHPSSGIDYRVFLRGGEAWMSYDRPVNPALSGERQLQYFIGSGLHGRTYLYQQQGLWFELPINFYTRRAGWGMAPAFDDATSMPAVLPTDPNCLHCHATEVQRPLPEAHNRFATVPFRQGGVGCSACHGDPAAHLAAKGHGGIVNPSRLPVAARDSACLQCHLEGDAVVYRAGRSLATFKVGEDLSASAVYFVRASQQAGGGRASSQWEALLRSACERAAGDRLTCTTCHDPHGDPVAAERVQYFRSKCLACHSDPQLAVTHFPEQPNCAGCHMPTRSTTDISHEQTTDHDIEARPTNRGRELPRAGEELLPVGGIAAGDREFGIAYAQLAARGDAAAARRALRLLTAAAAAGADDPELETRLGYLRQVSGDGEQARAAYAAALAKDPFQPTALANLGVLDAGSGRLPEAVQLLERLVVADPSQTAAGLNLAFIVCKLGHPVEAGKLAAELARFNPDSPALRQFVTSGDYGGQHCLPAAR